MLVAQVRIATIQVIESLNKNKKPIARLSATTIMENFKSNELPNPAEFMMLGEDAFNKNVHEKLRETLSPTEKQMWINGYLLAWTEQNKR
jgi:hypothetical protein